MLAPKLLEILACPKTKQGLRLASDNELERLNAAVKASTLKTTAGATVSESLQAALVREDGRIAFPIRDGIPILLFEDALQIPW